MEQASTEKLKHTGPAEKEKSGLSATKRAVGKDARAAFAKTESNRAVSSDHQIVREESLTLARASPWREKRGSQREHGKEIVGSTVKDGRLQGRKGGKARRASLEEVEGSMSG